MILNFDSFGEDPHREGLVDTPRRVAKMYGELLCGYRVDIDSIFTTFETEGYRDLVLVKDIPFYSLCEHHFLPFFGVAHIGYIPQKRIVGLSKLSRVLDAYARRLQIQERLTAEVAECLDHFLQPLGVMVVIEAEHMCMSMRGVMKSGTTTVTSAVRGSFDTDAVLRGEFLSLIGRK